MCGRKFLEGVEILKILGAVETFLVENYQSGEFFLFHTAQNLIFHKIFPQFSHVPWIFHPTVQFLLDLRGGVEGNPAHTPPSTICVLFNLKNSVVSLSTYLIIKLLYNIPLSVVSLDIGCRNLQKFAHVHCPLRKNLQTPCGVSSRLGASTRGKFFCLSSKLRKI